MEKMVNKLFNNIYSGKKVLITGNTGFKGSWLTIWLLKLGAKVYGISKGIPTNPSIFKTLDLESKITYYQEDLRNLDALKNIVNEIKPDFVFHLAAQPLVVTSYLDPIDTISTNVIGTAHILESLRHSNHPCVGVIITSDKCYDNVEWVWGYKETDALGGKDIYSGSKGAAEVIIKSYYHSFFKDTQKSNTRVLSARAGNVIGGGDWADYRIVPDCIKAWSNNKKVDIRNPNATRPWQHVLEPLSGYLASAEALYNNIHLNGENFNFGPKPEYSQSVEELITDLSKIFNYNEPADAYSATGDLEFHEAKLLKLNCDKALYYLKWLPALDYPEVIEFTGKWYYNYYHGDRTELYKITLEQIEQYEKKAIEKGIKWAWL